MHNKLCFKQLLEDARQMKDIDQKWYCLDEAMIELAEFAKEHDKKFYEEVYINLYGDLMGNHFDEKMAMIAVENMKNEDSSQPTGASYEYAEAMEIGKKFGIGRFDKYTEYDFYVALCMIKSDYYDDCFTDEDYCRLAKQWLEDKDVAVGNEKMWKYWTEIVLDI